jgi:hypothetical protein
MSVQNDFELFISASGRVIGIQLMKNRRNLEDCITIEWNTSMF